MSAMTLAKKAILLFGDVTYLNYVRALAPALWYRQNEPSGATAANSGSLGAANDGTYTSCTLAQAGKLGAVNAVLFDGANSKIAVPAGAYGNYAASTVAMLINPASAGESGIGTLFDVATGISLRFNGLASLVAARVGAGNATATTTSGLAASAWAWLFWTLDWGGDKKIRLYKGLSGALTEYAYSAQNAGSGAMTDYSAQAGTVGNRADQSRTYAGVYDEFLWFNKVLSLSQMAQIVKATGV